MKVFLFLFFALLTFPCFSLEDASLFNTTILSSSIQSENQPDEEVLESPREEDDLTQSETILIKTPPKKIYLEVQGSLFYPTDSTFRKIYSLPGMVGFELSIQTKDQMYSWISGSVIPKQGSSLPLHDKTNLLYLPVGIGLKYLKNFKIGEYFIAIGALPAYLYTHDFVSFMKQVNHRWGIGGIIKTGAIFNLRQGVYIDIFVDYSYMNISNHDTQGSTVYPRTADLSGVNFGIGIGYRFN